MSSFEWMELQTLTNDIELARSRLVEARKSGDRGRVTGLEEEITRAESRRLQLLAHISTNIVTIPEAKGKDGAGARQAPAPEAVPEEPPGEAARPAEPPPTETASATAEIASAPEPEPPKARDGAGPRPAPETPAEASRDEADEQPPPVEAVSAPEPPSPSKAREGAGARPVSAKADSIEGGTMWDQLTPNDIERVKAELGTRRTEMLARHAEELKELDAEQSQLETL